MKLDDSFSSDAGLWNWIGWKTVVHGVYSFKGAQRISIIILMCGVNWKFLDVYLSCIQVQHQEMETATTAGIDHRWSCRDGKIQVSWSSLWIKRRNTNGIGVAYSRLLYNTGGKRPTKWHDDLAAGMHGDFHSYAPLRLADVTIDYMPANCPS